MKMYLLVLSLFFQPQFCSKIQFQVRLRRYNQPDFQVNVKLTATGTVTDNDGKFTLNTTAKLPFVIEVSSVGFGVKI
jgi:hypothetical protein